MSRWHSYVHTATHIVQTYQGEMPFAQYLKQYFSAHKKHGSQDRKWISQCCYSWFRLGRSAPFNDPPLRMLAALFLNEDASPFATVLPENWLPLLTRPLEARAAFLQQEWPAFTGRYFPFADALSPQIDATAFNASHLQQPDMFLRLRPGHDQTVPAKLAAAGIPFERQGPGCLRLPAASRLNGVLHLNREAVVQDLNSQRVAELFPHIPEQPVRVWDCCAASGGKSILAADHYGAVELVATDVRASIIHNLHRRFGEAGLRPYQAFVADLQQPLRQKPGRPFHLVICDAPCSGSGTWGRAPEQLCYFEREKIHHYSHLQKTIAGHCLPLLQRQGFLLYITCSVFREENEAVVEHLRAQHKLELLQMEYFKGYTMAADTLFAALLRLSA